MSRSIAAKTSIAGLRGFCARASRSPSPGCCSMSANARRSVCRRFEAAASQLGMLDWDRQVTTLRQHEGTLLGYWGSQPRLMIDSAAMVRHAAPAQPPDLSGRRHHRHDDRRRGAGQFLEGLRAEWAASWTRKGEPETLRLLIERFNPANYTFEVRDGRRVPVGFQWPEAIARQNAEDLRRIGAESTAMSLPQQCRDRLDAARPLSQEELIWLWDYLQNMDASPRPSRSTATPSFTPKTSSAAESRCSSF